MFVPFAWQVCGVSNDGTERPSGQPRDSHSRAAGFGPERTSPGERHSSSRHAHAQRGHGTLITAWAWLLGLALVVAGTLPGCSCQPDPLEARRLAEAKKKKEEEEKKKKKEEKPKPDFEASRPRVEPNDDNVRNAVKPGHWVTTTQRFKANNFDFPGELVTEVGTNTGQPVFLERNPYRMVMSRPAPLPKGQTREFDAVYFIPRRPVPREGETDFTFNPSQRLVSLKSTLESRVAGRAVFQTSELAEIMPDYRFDFVVLSATPDRYGYLKMLDCVASRAGELDSAAAETYYRVVTPKLAQSVPLPRSSLTWTSIAYVLVDDVDPKLFTTEQQRALVDWLHWGGQLIISGPRSLDLLKGSFLGPYLPALADGAVQLDAAAFAELDDNWSLGERGRPRRTIPIVAGQPLDGVVLKLQTGGEFMPTTGQLVAERRLGRGRIVTTAFSLTARPIVNWGNLDGFYNGSLLRRPARRFSEDVDGFSGVRVHWAEHGDKRLDPRLYSQLRFASRDLAHAGGGIAPIRRRAPPAAGPAIDEPAAARPDFDPPEEGNTTARPGEGPLDPIASSAGGEAWDIPLLHDRGYRAGAQSGVAGWNDFSGPADAARQALKEAAGISVPRAEFVVRVLVVYLAILVPLNFCFFKLIGRVEWAWVAAPVIAVAAAGAVVRFAQLDIGFARSHTEIDVVEIYADYPRAHLTRYTALYTSLSTSYDFVFDDASAQSQPFSVAADDAQLAIQTRREVTYRRDTEVAIRGYQVISNSTGMVHSEQMIDLGGPLRLVTTGGSVEVANDSDLALEGAGLVRRVSKDVVEIAWIGTLAARSSRGVRFVPARDFKTLFSQWEDAPVTRSAAEVGELSLRRLLDLVQDPRRFDAGDVKLIGWSDREIPGMTVTPAASQSLVRALVVAHLSMARLPEPERDANSRLSLVRAEPE
jgi:hypothetical protein